MNANLTISTLSFEQKYSDATGSLRVETSRGVNLPEKLFIRSQQITDGKTKLPATLTTIVFERHLALTGGSIGPVSAKLSVVVPQDVLVTSSDVLAVVERYINLLQEDDSGLDLADEIFVGGQQ
jgi:hypothetical protein